MTLNKDLYKKIILFIGEAEQYKPYFTIDEVEIPGYTKQEIYDHISLMIEGKIIQGVFASDDDFDKYGYLIGALSIEARYLYNQLKKNNSA